MKKKLKIVLWIIIAIAAIAGIGWCVYSNAARITNGNSHPEVTFELGDYGTVKMELYPEYAPNTVANFIKLVESGYYTNKVVYGKDSICLYVGRTSEGEAENPKLSTIDSSVEADSDKDYEYTIKGEFVANGYSQNTLRHQKGVVSLIRNDYTQYVQSLSDESYNSGNAQIGIMMSDDSNSLNGAYAAFAKITEGMDVLEKIYNEAEIATSTDDESTTEVTTEDETEVITEDTSESEEEEDSSIKEFATYPVITSATVDTHGINYGMPEVEEAFDYSSYMYNLMSSYYSN